MEQAQRTALRKCRVRLVNDLQIGRMYDAIESHQLLTPIMLEHVKAKEARPDKVRHFLDLLQRRGPDAFDLFTQILRETSHDSVANYVTVEYLDQSGNGIGRLTISPATRVPRSSPRRHNIYHTQESQGRGQRVNNLPNGELADTEQESEMEVSNGSYSGVEESGQSLPGSSASGTCPTVTWSQSNNPAICYRYAASPATANRHHVGYTGNLEEEYKMNTAPRGLLLIINNHNFRGHMPNRDGTDIDRDKLKTLFLELGFGVEVRNNLTEMEMRANLNALSHHEQLWRVDCLVIAILTHGNDEYVYGVDGKYLNVNEAYRYFTAERCPALHHKPKFFIMNACRGDAEDGGVITRPSGEGGSVARDIEIMPPVRELRTRIPNMKDFLVAYSTIPGHVSWRHLNEGSFFVQGFVKVFQEHVHTTDVLKMLVKVNQEVSRQVNHAGVQIPGPQVMLTKTWFLNPPIHNRPS